MHSESNVPKIRPQALNTAFEAEYAIENFEQAVASVPQGDSISVPCGGMHTYNFRLHFYPNGFGSDSAGSVTVGCERSEETEEDEDAVHGDWGAGLIIPGHNSRDSERVLGTLTPCIHYGEDLTTIVLGSA